MDKLLIDKVKSFVKNLFEEKYDQRSSYHSYEHTSEVADAAEKIGKNSKLTEEELELVVVAAYLHDIGYLYTHENHEAESAKVAEEFLASILYPADKRKKVLDNILATRMNYIPTNLMEEVIHDADYINLANPDYLKQSNLLKIETINYGGRDANEEEWLSGELQFLINHTFYTEYGRSKLQEKKIENVKKIKKKLKKHREYTDLVLNIDNTAQANGEVKKSEEEIKIKPVDKKEALKLKYFSIKEFETIYKLTSTNHMRLNAIADRKANIMLTLNGIIISLTMSIVASTPASNPRLLITSSILIIVCLATIVFATLSTRPTVTTGTIKQEDIDNKTANLLFFGNFSNMGFENYDAGMRKMMTDQEYLHNAMIQDFYNLGRVLDSKFKYLRICYNIFMIGIVLAVLSITILIALGY